MGPLSLRSHKLVAYRKNEAGKSLLSATEKVTESEYFREHIFYSLYSFHLPLLLSLILFPG